jgi:hypothetical protein
MGGQANKGPKEILALEQAFRSVPGVTEVTIGKHLFSADEMDQLEEVRFSGPYADLPIAMLRRTGGNLANEILIFVEFEIQQNAAGLKALEFLSWWVRDESRSGENLQIRSLGLPPMVGQETQLGNTLRFWFEAYIVTEKEDIRLVLGQVEEYAESLTSCIDNYNAAFHTA